ncbi:MAG: lipid-A-disaccharide synthase, partial [Thermodesulfobacteriota bacterium]|nr:lipid-A-disaccharide synthase [Thermodesulfobacteriota bacterium]
PSGLTPHYPVVGLLPGSRTEEIRNLLPVMVKSIEILRRHYPEILCLLPVASTIKPEFIQAHIDSPSLDIRVIKGGIYEVLRACDIALVASGTVTLETAIMGVPLIIVYKVSPVTYWLGRMVIKVPYIGLVNLVAGQKVAPELIQGQVVPDRLAHEALNILEDTEATEKMKEKLKGIREDLGRGGASEKTARIAMEMME